MRERDRGARAAERVLLAVDVAARQVALHEEIPRRSAPDYDWLARHIARVLEREDLNLAQLAARLDFGARTIPVMLKERKRPGAELLVKLADAAGDRREDWLRRAGLVCS